MKFSEYMQKLLKMLKKCSFNVIFYFFESQFINFQVYFKDMLIWNLYDYFPLKFLQQNSPRDVKTATRRPQTIK